MSEGFFDPYKVLGVDREADEEIIKATHRVLSKRYHPDRGTGDDGVAAMVLANRARDLLLDPVRRREIDAELERRRSASQVADGGRSPSPADSHVAEPDPESDSWDQWEEEWGTESEWHEEPARTYPYPSQHPPRYEPPAPGPERYQAHWPPQAPVARAPWDRVSIAALVAAVLCGPWPIGVLLGIIGLFRTSRSRRRGRWIAWTAIAISGLFTVAGQLNSVLQATSSGSAMNPWVADEDAVAISKVSAGDCLVLDEQWSSSDIRRVGCDAAHDARVLHQGRFARTRDHPLKASDAAPFCQSLVSAGKRRGVRVHESQIRVIMVGDRARAPQRGEYFLCVVESRG